ncbi:hypothetical protein Lgee_1859 [Legionella geestiana]|uniref:Uncharacterized protein n=1 Tax=Legionella geestiana TaxID=45065 RepID=A0A0W0TNN0_9GAMM|nr:hypothetical protein [Legionella geestiana]KTC97198.1 hypothetical protein Lgee_1859 [Legionella geestiana]QBS12333.1 hypothetical protein E4T54_06015 [Legionella geestiana]QDQ39955.1 hypothetical protein E3226_005850 [Legionella geestiana]STX55231.1 Uncharacterised protein [Legionella geestiana]
MSEKQQHTTCRLREKMLNRYDDGLHHKHDKYHMSYRQHARSHPVNGNALTDGENAENLPTGLIREFRLRKIRKRLDKGRFH